MTWKYPFSKSIYRPWLILYFFISVYIYVIQICFLSERKTGKFSVNCIKSGVRSHNSTKRLYMRTGDAI